MVMSIPCIRKHKWLHQPQFCKEFCTERFVSSTDSTTCIHRIEVFTNSQQCKNATVASFVLPVPLEMDKTYGVSDLIPTDI